jgi:hypothetical protein
MSPEKTADPRRRSFYRKLAYVAGICLLLFPLFVLGHPATHGTRDTPGRSGGVLAQLRNDPEHGFSQTQLGEIDMTSETFKLATLGMRGIAVQVLWAKYNKYRMQKNFSFAWDLLQQLKQLAPHFTKVWEHLAWDITYNVSVAQDDYKDKFFWVVGGAKYLKEGIALNGREPRLPRELGRFISQKVGRADETPLYRALFRDEAWFQTEGEGLPLNAGYNEQTQTREPLDLRDNWQVGKAWYREAERVLAEYHVYAPGLSRPVFYSDAPLAQMYYAMALEKDGSFGADAQQAWRTAGRDWHEFGERELPAGDEGTVRLNDYEPLVQEANECTTALDKLAPGVRDEIRGEKVAKLRSAERKALDTPADKRTEDEVRAAYEAQSRIEVTNDEVANRLAQSLRRQLRKLPRDSEEAQGMERKAKEALSLAQRAAKAQEQAKRIDRQRSIVNFAHWRLRAEVEQTRDMLDARRAIYDADQAMAGARIAAALAGYENGFALWRKVIDSHPALADDSDFGYDVVEAVGRYRRARGQDEKADLPQPFILQDVLNKHEKRR